jgi:predicted RNase H-like HicB family nuclease
MTYTVVFDYDPEEHVYNVSVPSLPGCYTWGKTKALAMKHAKEMIRTFLDAQIGLTIEQFNKMV